MTVSDEHYCSLYGRFLHRKVFNILSRCLLLVSNSLNSAITPLGVISLSGKIKLKKYIFKAEIIVVATSLCREGIIKTDAGVNILLKRVLEALKPGLHRELQVLQKMKQEWCKQRNSSELSRDSRLYPWDVPFFATQMKQRMWKETSTKLR